MLLNILNRIKSKIIRDRKINNFLLSLPEKVTLGFEFTFNSNENSSYNIGRNCHLNGHWQIYGKLKIGNNVSFRRGSLISITKSIEIGNNVFAAEGVFITDNDGHPIDPLFRKKMTQTKPGSYYWKPDHELVAKSNVIIEDNVWIGKNAMILKGVRIGENSIIGAGSVVVKNIPSNSIVGGNPAKLIRNL